VEAEISTVRESHGPITEGKDKTTVGIKWDVGGEMEIEWLGENLLEHCVWHGAWSVLDSREIVLFTTTLVVPAGEMTSC
jgi:hypothetical protein